jgi:ADP-ribosyl-[dinitrogen reductase] hydrolase
MKPRPRTSLDSPLRIDAVAAGPNGGLIGMTFCPGKKQPVAMSGAWDRDLRADVETVANWGASVVVTLMEAQEMDELRVKALPETLKERGIEWVHLPIIDGGVPSSRFERKWRQVAPALRERLRHGERFLVHCKGGLGRTGTIAAMLLVEFGVDAEEAIGAVRAARPGAIENEAQENYVRGLGRKCRA